VSASNVSDHTGKVVGRMASFIDITERKQLEKELRDSEKSFGSFHTEFLTLKRRSANHRS